MRLTSLSRRKNIHRVFAAGKEISCFNCDSNDDPRCLDPFNFTSHARDMPATMECEGCCVKLVQHRGTRECGHVAGHAPSTCTLFQRTRTCGEPAPTR